MSIAEKLQAIAESAQEVFDAGVAAEHQRFWDVFQNYGERFSYDSAFFGLYDQSLHYGWNDETYNPIYPIKLGTESKVVKNYGQKVFYYNTEITIPAITRQAQRALFKIFSSLNTSLPRSMVTRTLLCFIRVITTTVLFS